MPPANAPRWEMGRARRSSARPHAVPSRYLPPNHRRRSFLAAKLSGAAKRASMARDRASVCERPRCRRTRTSTVSVRTREADSERAIGCRSIQFRAENFDARRAARIVRPEATRAFAAGTRASTSGPPFPTSSAEAGLRDRLEASSENNAARSRARPRRCRVRETFQSKRRNQRHRNQEVCHPSRTAPLARKNGCGSRDGDRSRKMKGGVSAPPQRLGRRETELPDGSPNSQG